MPAVGVDVACQPVSLDDTLGASRPDLRLLRPFGVVSATLRCCWRPSEQEQAEAEMRRIRSKQEPEAG